MKSNDYYSNKNILGELTLEELRETVAIEGEFTIGKNWLPICKTRVSRRHKTLDFFMDSAEQNDSELEIPLETKVSVVGTMVSMRIYWPGHPNGRLVRIRLDVAPDWMF